MIYLAIFEISPAYANEDLVAIIKKWQDINLNRYLVYSKPDKGVFLTETPSSMRTLIRIKSKISKIINWQLLQHNYYLITWSESIKDIAIMYASKLIDILGCEFESSHTIRAFDSLKESGYKRVIKLLDRWSIKNGKNRT